MKSCKTLIEQNFNQSELFQPGHEPRLDLHTTLEPGSEIPQDPKLSKSCGKSQLPQLGQEPQHDLHTVKLLNSPYFNCTRLLTAVLHVKIIKKLSKCNEKSYLDSHNVYLSHI